ncbi:MAG: hypothetical protein P4L16_08020 [Chlamydiales bacterium]|nr:hypothetical protein [Chlamydiales bacterium]
MTANLNLSATNIYQNTEYSQNIIDKSRKSRFCCFVKFSQIILISPFTTTAKFTFRVVKLLTWDPIKAGVYKICGYHTESAALLEGEYLKTVKAVRDILFIPSIARRALIDMVATQEVLVDDIQLMTAQDFLNVKHVAQFEQFSSFLHGVKTFEIIKPEMITEFPATNDPTLKTVMASNIFKSGIMAINFGIPNVSTFVTKSEKDGAIQTVKVDAKSLRREAMTYHATNGKIQSGVFLIPSNLPKEALERFEQAAKDLEGRKDITCVNTNCRVLQQAGFSIEGVVMDDVVFPNTFMEHLMFRNVFFTDSSGVKHKVHFKILNTTEHSLEKFFEDVDTAVVGTRLRHRVRHADTEENQKTRGIAAKALIAQEKTRLEAAGPLQEINDEYLGKRKVTVSVPSFLGEAVSRIWGRHTIYELDLSSNKKDIFDAFQKFATEGKKDQRIKLRPFAQEKPSFSTRLKRDFFFSMPMIRFLRRHMMGREDTIYLHTQDIFKHLKSTNGERLNYVLLDDKMVIARVNANGTASEKHRKVADWALSKHALLAGRQDVYCSGEMWYDKEKNRFMMNYDSGTYSPTIERVKEVANLANRIFDAAKFDNSFEAVAETKVA